MVAMFTKKKWLFSIWVSQSLLWGMIGSSKTNMLGPKFQSLEHGHSMRLRSFTSADPMMLVTGIHKDPPIGGRLSLQLTESWSKSRTFSNMICLIVRFTRVQVPQSSSGLIIGFNRLCMNSCSLITGFWQRVCRQHNRPPTSSDPKNLRRLWRFDFGWDSYKKCHEDFFLGLTPLHMRKP